MAASLGPENETQWLSKPVEVNKHVFLIPSAKNKTFQEYLQRHTFRDVSEFIRDGGSKSGGIYGKLVQCTSPPPSPGDNKKNQLTVDLQDVQTLDSISIIFKGESSRNFSLTAVEYAMLYVFGGRRIVGEDGRVGLVCSDSCSDLMCYLINRWAYKRRALMMSPPTSSRSSDRGSGLGLLSPIKLNKGPSLPSFSVASKATPPCHSPVSKARNPFRKAPPTPTTSKKTGNKLSSKSSPSSSDPYIYTQLSRLSDLPIHGRVNIAGVVSFFKPSQRSKGTDYFVSFTLVDSTTPLDSPISVVAFNKDESKLPKIRQVGDIILLRRTEVGTYKDLPQIKVKFYSSFLVFDGYSVSPPHPPPYCSSHNASISDSDMKTVKDLKQWKSYLSEFQFKRLSDVEFDVSTNVKCYVVSVTKLIPDRLLSLTVCDGTVPFSNSPSSSSSSSSSGNSILCTVLLFLKPSTPLRTEGIVPGSCISLRKVIAQRVHIALDTMGNSCLELHLSLDYCDQDRLYFLQEDDPDTVSLRQSYSHSPQTFEMRDFPRLVAMTPHVSHPPTTLAVVTATSPTSRTNYRSLVQVVGIDARHTLEIIVFICSTCRTKFQPSRGPMTQCLSCKARSPSVDSSLMVEYEFVLTVRDDTETLSVLVRGREAENFMQLKPSNFHVDSHRGLLAYERLKSLFGCDPFQDYLEGEPMLMDCAFYAAPSLGGSGTVHCLFDTFIVSESVN